MLGKWTATDLHQEKKSSIDGCFFSPALAKNKKTEKTTTNYYMDSSLKFGHHCCWVKVYWLAFTFSTFLVRKDYIITKGSIHAGKFNAFPLNLCWEINLLHSAQTLWWGHSHTFLWCLHSSWMQWNKASSTITRTQITHEYFITTCYVSCPKYLITGSLKNLKSQANMYWKYNVCTASWFPLHNNDLYCRVLSVLPTSPLNGVLRISERTMVKDKADIQQLCEAVTLL